MTRVTFVGAGRVVFTRQLVADLLGLPELAGTGIVLYDTDPSRLAVAEGRRVRSMSPSAGSRCARPGPVSTPRSTCPGSFDPRSSCRDTGCGPWSISASVARLNGQFRHPEIGPVQRRGLGAPGWSGKPS
jgi:hypothetical protein